MMSQAVPEEQKFAGELLVLLEKEILMYQKSCAVRNTAQRTSYGLDKENDSKNPDYFMKN